MTAPTRMSWVVLTRGDRPDQLDSAVASIGDQSATADVVLVANGLSDTDARFLPETDTLVSMAQNVGVPAGRDAGLRAASAEIVGFLDDDAEFRGRAADVVREFAEDPNLAVVSFRLVDESGSSSRRHVPRPGRGDGTRGGPVAHFLGGACAMRRDAYEEVGGYFGELFYGHEELELSWRLIDNGWTISYLTDVEVFHPRTEIGRHGQGWWLTGRNRVWIARRTLPWPVAILHVTVWLVAGVVKAPGWSCTRSYLSGLWSGFRTSWGSGSRRRPISWSTVWRLTRLGRPPII